MGGWWVESVLSMPMGEIILVSWVFWVVVSIVLHELGHGVVAIRCGDDTPIHLGHMTWNPLVHIPGMAWLMFALFGFTWGLMPTNPYNYRGRYDDAKVAAAGPAVNLVLFTVCAVACGLWTALASGLGDPAYANFRAFFWIGAVLNLMGVFFNLVPVPPLDGSRILSNLVPAYQRLWEHPNAGVIGLIAFMALFFYGAGLLWGLAFGVADMAISAVESAVP
jgi:Zn-dependent protease